MYQLKNIKPINKLSKKNLKMLEMAVSEAEKSDFKSSKRLGASINYKNKIFINGYNSHRTRIGQIKCISLHAEISAIFNLLKYHKKNATLKSKIILPKSDIYVVRLMKNKKNLPIYRKHLFGNSKPCLNCQQKLSKYNVKRIFYTDIHNNIEVLCELNLKS